MTDKKRVSFFVTFDEDFEIIDKLDKIKEQEKLNLPRSFYIRKALRFFLDNCPSQETDSLNGQIEQGATS